MEADSWNRLSIGSRQHHSRSGLYNEGEDDMDNEDELRHEFLCPFCAEEYDMVGLCCHIDDEHSVEAKNGVCPVCAKRVGIDLVGHIIMQHGSLLKVHRKRILRKGGSNLKYFISRKELQDESLQSFLGGSQSLASSNAEPDPLLSSFISNLSTVNEPLKEKENYSVEASSEEELSMPEALQRNVQESPLSAEDQEKRAKRSEFVQGLLFSTFMTDNL